MMSKWLLPALFWSRALNEIQTSRTWPPNSDPVSLNFSPASDVGNLKHKPLDNKSRKLALTAILSAQIHTLE